MESSREDTSRLFVGRCAWRVVRSAAAGPVVVSVPPAGFLDHAGQGEQIHEDQAGELEQLTGLVGCCLAPDRAMGCFVAQLADVMGPVGKVAGEVALVGEVVDLVHKSSLRGALTRERDLERAPAAHDGEVGVCIAPGGTRGLFKGAPDIFWEVGRGLRFPRHGLSSDEIPPEAREISVGLPRTDPDLALWREDEGVSGLGAVEALGEGSPELAPVMACGGDDQVLAHDCESGALAAVAAGT